MQKTKEYLKAREKAIRYILYRPRTISEVYNKLKELECEDNVISLVIEDLIELEYLNDEEYVKKFIESKKKLQKFSKNMIKLKLKSKGVSSDLIDKYLFDFSDIEAILKVLTKKKYSKDMEYEEKNKIKAYCLRKGFSMEDVTNAMRKYER